MANFSVKLFLKSLVCFIGLISSVFLLRDILIEQEIQYEPEYIGENKTRAAKVIIVAYMRGGSTLMGEVFSSDPLGYLYYEPIWAAYGGIGRAINGNIKVRFTKNYRRQLAYFERRKIASFLTDLVQCNTEQWPDEYIVRGTRPGYSDMQFTRVLPCASKSMRNVRTEGDHCFSMAENKINYNVVPDVLQAYFVLKKNRGIPLANYTLEDQLALTSSLGGNTEVVEGMTNKLNKVINCHHRISNVLRPCMRSLDIQGICMKKQVRAAKTVTNGMHYVEDVLDLDPEVKVIHLLRDPRGIVNSRSRLFGGKQGIDYFHSMGRTVCDRMLHDIHVKHVLEQRYPDRFMTVHYEDFVAKQRVKIKEIYKFLGLTWSAKAEKNYFKRTASRSGSALAHSTRRSNSVAVSVAWKTKMTPEKKEAVDEHCREVYRILGYDP